MTTGTERGNSAMSLDRAPAEPALQELIDFVRCLKKQPPCCNTSGLSWTAVSKWRAVGHVASRAPFFYSPEPNTNLTCIQTEQTSVARLVTRIRRHKFSHPFCFNFFTLVSSMFYSGFWDFIDYFWGPSGIFFDMSNLEILEKGSFVCSRVMAKN